MNDGARAVDGDRVGVAVGEVFCHRRQLRKVVPGQSVLVPDLLHQQVPVRLEFEMRASSQGILLRGKGSVQLTSSSTYGSTKDRTVIFQRIFLANCHLAD